MIRTYNYELWNGKKVLGYYSSIHQLCGNRMVVYETSTLKQSYKSYPKTFEIPITTRIVSYDGIDMLSRIVLDVRKKSKRQIDIMKTSVQL